MKVTIVVALLLAAAFALQFSIDYWCLDSRLYCYWQGCIVRTCHGQPTGREVAPILRR